MREWAKRERNMQIQTAERDFFQWQDPEALQGRGFTVFELNPKAHKWE